MIDLNIVPNSIRVFLLILYFEWLKNKTSLEFQRIKSIRRWKIERENQPTNSTHNVPYIYMIKDTPNNQRVELRIKTGIKKK